MHDSERNELQAAVEEKNDEDVFLPAGYKQIF